jgi:dTDP-4-dehydrorhamnose 3,5-epimerase
MLFTATPLPGAFVIEPERLEDSRGFFARTWCQREYEARSLTSRLVQCSISSSNKKGTLRGIHYQIAPYEEAKLVRCTSGAIFDVIVDLRPQSPTFRQHFSAILTALNHVSLFIPEGVAHGFLTMEDNTEVFYQMSEFHSPKHARGVRWNDPAFGVEWPLTPVIMSERDRGYPDFLQPD